MPRRNRKKQNNIPYFRLFKYFVLGVFAIFIVCVICLRTTQLFKGSKQFTIKKVFVDPSIDFVKSREISKLKGRNIFDVDLQKVQSRLRSQYPQVAKLRVIKRYPDQIHILAKRRNAFARARIKNRTFTIDREGVVLSDTQESDQVLPLVVGVTSPRNAIMVGYPFKGRDLRIALFIIRELGTSQVLSTYPIARIDVRNLSKINIHFSNDFTVIVDRDNISDKIKMLEVLISEDKVDLKEMDYIDLRFKEPIIKKE